MYELEKAKKNTKKFKQIFQLTTTIALLLTLIGNGNIAMVLASAPAAGSADTMWNTIADFVGTWVFRLGGVTVFVGGIMFFMGWRSEDAEARGRGVATMISGGGVMALAGLVGIFFGTTGGTPPAP